MKYYITIYKTDTGADRADIRTNPKYCFMDIPAIDIEPLKRQILNEQPKAVFITA